MYSSRMRERGPGGEGRLAHLVAEGGRAEDCMEGRDLTAKAPKCSKSKCYERT